LLTTSLTTTDSTTTVNSTRATGTTGNDTVLLPFAVSIGTIDLLAGSDKLTLSSDGNNTLIVRNVETVIGGAGNDTITLGTALGAGLVDLGGGIDSLTLSSAGNNLLTVLNAETIFGGAFNDTITLGSAASGIVVDLKGGLDTLTLSSVGINSLTVSNAETIIGGFASDTIKLGAPLLSGNIDLGGADDKLIVALSSNNSGWGTLNGGANMNNDLSILSNHGDTFAFNGSLDLTMVPNTGAGSMSGIETLSMQDALGGPGNSFLKLNSGDVIALGTGIFSPAGGTLASKDALRIDGDSGDTVDLTGGGWTPQTATNLPSGYDLYVHTTSGHEDAYALVQHLISVFFV
jgi:hypothetical protein